MIQKIKKYLLSAAVFGAAFFISLTMSKDVDAFASEVADYVAFVYVTPGDIELNIGEEFKLFAVTSTLKKTKWSSSMSSIASVNAEGVVTAKKAGTAKITAKIKNADDCCRVRVLPTKIDLVSKSVTLERGQTATIRWTTSNGHIPKFKSNRSSVATVDEKGNIRAYKPGDATITLKVDGSSASFTVNVKKPEVKLNKSEISLFKGQLYKLDAFVSSGAEVVWKSKKSSVAVVDENGTVTAVKNGTTLISATADGVSRFCTVTVMKPEIKLDKEEFELVVGKSCSLTAKVNSGGIPEWSVSNQRVLEVDEKGTVTALQKGKGYVYAKLDGTKVKCRVTVTEP